MSYLFALLLFHLLDPCEGRCESEGGDCNTDMDQPDDYLCVCALHYSGTYPLCSRKDKNQYIKIHEHLYFFTENLFESYWHQLIITSFTTEFKQIYLYV